MTREETLIRWVQQPPAGPNVQYLRDTERRRALDQLGRRRRVLDVASESTVTAGIDAQGLTRVDFSAAASEHAADGLGAIVDRYEAIDPAEPVLPFDDDAFDGAISIGPYDWKFLDIERLTTELRRVLSPDGLFTFSVPTPRSPYARHNRGRYRYFSPEAALNLVSPGWQLVDADLVFQYPAYGHHAINALPDRHQEPFVALARRVSDRLTERELRDRASYLVFGVRPFDFETGLDRALDCLFRPTEDNGFWDAREGKIVRALDYDLAGNAGTAGESHASLAWRSDDSIQWRYAPLALLGALRWRVSPLGSSAYDGRIERELAYFAERVADVPTRDRIPSYGIGPLIGAFALADRTFADPAYLQVARDLHEHSVDRFDFDHAEDCLLAYGWSFLYERERAHTASDEHARSNGHRNADTRSAEPDGRAEAVRGHLDDALWRMNDRLTREGFFSFDNPTTRRHQNQMYALWGVCRAIAVLDEPGYLDGAKRVLDRTIDRRMRADGAFVWEDVPRYRRAHSALTERFGAQPPHWKFLYACHQSFFVTAVAEFYRAGGPRTYDRAAGKAMGWLAGDNPLGTDLTELSGIGVPMRQLTTDGRIDVPGQTFKGAYEVGARLMALTDLLAGPWTLAAPNRKAGSPGSTDRPVHSRAGGVDAAFR